jgi:hypothetical protein
MVLKVEIPESGAQVEGKPDEKAPKAKKAAVVVPVPTSIDLDALLQKIGEAKPSAGGTGRAPSVIASQIADVVRKLLEKAKALGVERLPLGTSVKAVAVNSFGVEAGKKSQYFYTLGQSVLKILGDEVETQKEGRTLFLVCK